MKPAILLANERIRRRSNARKSLKALRDIAKHEHGNLSRVDNGYLNLAMMIFSRDDRGETVELGG
jgi:hypothetical protein